MGATHESQTNNENSIPTISGVITPTFTYPHNQWCHYSNIHLSPQSMVSLPQHLPIPTINDVTTPTLTYPAITGVATLTIIYSATSGVTIPTFADTRHQWFHYSS